MTHHIDLDTITLAEGAHPDRSGGLCIMEAVAWWAGEPHTDHPACVSLVLGKFGRGLNDVLPQDKRQELRPLIPQLAATGGDGLDEVRGYLALDWLIRTWVPAWLDLVPVRDGDSGCRASAEELRQLPLIRDLESAGLAGPVVRQASRKAAAARDAAEAAAWAAARAAARDAAWAAARDAAEAAARAAAREKLASTVGQLQDSVINLYRAMMHPEGTT